MFCFISGKKHQNRILPLITKPEASVGNNSKSLPFPQSYDEMLKTSNPVEMRVTQETLAAEKRAFLRTVIAKSEKIPAKTIENPGRHTRITAKSGKRYSLYNRLTPEDCDEIAQKTGRRFPEGRCVIGEGRFGRIRFARDEETGEILVAKKIANYERFRNESFDQLSDNNYVELRDMVVAKTSEKQMGHECYIHCLLPDTPTILKARDLAVVQVNPYQPTQVKAYLFFSYLPQSDLDKSVKHLFELREKGVPQQKLEDMVCSWASDMITSVANLHQSGIYHLDIKPENFVVNKDGRIELSDFGFTTNTAYSDQYAGTALYAPPEILNPKQHPYACEKADLYSLGRTLECLAWMLEAMNMMKPRAADQLNTASKVDRYYNTAHEFFQSQQRPVGLASSKLFELGNALAHPDPAQRASLSTIENAAVLAQKPKGLALSQPDRAELFAQLFDQKS